MRAAIALLAVKATVWLIALGSVTSGGVLMPLLLLGSALGYLLGHFLPGGSALWALAGMAGILSGAMRAPLMAALFAVEQTGDFPMLPLTLAASVEAYAVSVLVMPRSILTEKIARRARHILQEYTVDPFEFLQASQVMTAEPETLPEMTTIVEAIAFFGSVARHRSYPVVDANGLLPGLVSRSDVLAWRLGAFEDNVSLAEVLGDVSQPHANPRDPVAHVADLMIETGVGRHPIVEPVSGKVVGILTRHDLLRSDMSSRI